MEITTGIKVDVVVIFQDSKESGKEKINYNNFSTKLSKSYFFPIFPEISENLLIPKVPLYLFVDIVS